MFELENRVKPRKKYQILQNQAKKTILRKMGKNRQNRQKQEKLAKITDFVKMSKIWHAGIKNYCNTISMQRITSVEAIRID